MILSIGPEKVIVTIEQGGGGGSYNTQITDTFLSTSGWGFEGRSVPCRDGVRQQRWSQAGP